MEILALGHRRCRGGATHFHLYTRLESSSSSISASDGVSVLADGPQAAGDSDVGTGGPEIVTGEADDRVLVVSCDGLSYWAAKGSDGMVAFGDTDCGLNG